MARIGMVTSWTWFTLFFILALSGFFAFKSVRPVLHLRANPPAEFFNVQRNWSPQQRAQEERLARVYWEAAERMSRGAFPHGARLPDEPAELFRVDTRSYPSAVEGAAAARARYWRNLRSVWGRPEVWVTSYEWRTDWLFRGTNY